MTSHLRIKLVFLLLVGALGGHHALATGPSECKVRFLQFVRNKVLPLIVANPAKRILQGVEASTWWDAHIFEMKVGSRIAFGMKGGVYHIDHILGLPQADKYIAKGVDLVLKNSHRGKRTGLMKNKYQRVLKEEKMVYDAILRGVPAMEAVKEWFPEDPSWERGYFPIVPIVADIYMPEYGNGLIKTELVGTFPKAIATTLAKQAGKKQIELQRSDIPEEMIRSMKEWYRLSQAASLSLKITPEGEPERGLTSLDINPDNLVWVTDPKQKEAMHLTRDSFVAVELGEPSKACYRAKELPPSPGKSSSEITLKTEDEYIEMWVNFLREAI